MEHARAVKVPREAVESDESSIFKAEGTSDSLSSEPPMPARPHKRLHGKRKGPPQSSVGMEGDQPERPPTSSKAPIGIGGATFRRFKVVLVGYSNAVGYCETLKGDFSLRKSLSTQYDIIVAGKSGTSWVKISTNVHGELETYSKGQALGNREFDAVFTVLGTNDIP
jgi:hypothetical protein